MSVETVRANTTIGNGVDAALRAADVTTDTAATEAGMRPAMLTLCLDGLAPFSLRELTIIADLTGTTATALLNPTKETK